ncbi:hypothetical protein HYQ45_018836 [Verticillium longisporum]|uniref:Uncharacterized protein n=1 Tax=Verticillium longisporum TaxID=100787 RepID=A0A8I2ZWV0_VERLO|nr:hypothetical protein HYQ45_018836 [Verticillium longisporum]
MTRQNSNIRQYQKNTYAYVNLNHGIALSNDGRTLGISGDSAKYIEEGTGRYELASHAI